MLGAIQTGALFLIVRRQTAFQPHPRQQHGLARSTCRTNASGTGGGHPKNGDITLCYPD
jgi:hypothetical protein